MDGVFMDKIVKFTWIMAIALILFLVGLLVSDIIFDKINDLRI